MRQGIKMGKPNWLVFRHSTPILVKPHVYSIAVTEWPTSILIWILITYQIWELLEETQQDSSLSFLDSCTVNWKCLGKGRFHKSKHVIYCNLLILQKDKFQGLTIGHNTDTAYSWSHCKPHTAQMTEIHPVATGTPLCPNHPRKTTNISMVLAAEAAQTSHDPPYGFCALVSGYFSFQAWGTGLLQTLKLTRHLSKSDN